MKCPNCGSSAQFKLVDIQTTEKLLLRYYKCGCGTKAKVFYEQTKIIYTPPKKTLDNNN